MSNVPTDRVTSTLKGKYLRNAASRQWLGANGVLTDNLEDAVKVESVLEAIDLCRLNNLKGMEVVMVFHAGDEVSLPMV